MENEKKQSGFAVAALVLGIVGICLSFIPFVNYISYILAILGIVFAIISLVRKASKGMAIASLIICIVAAIVTVAVQIAAANAIYDAAEEFLYESYDAYDELETNFDDMTGDNTEVILANNCDVSFGTFSVSTDDFGINDTKVPVSVKNKSDEAKSFSIQVEAVDANGTRIDTDYVYADSLAAGQIQIFDVFKYVEESKIETMKSATFKVVSVSMY